MLSLHILRAENALGKPLPPGAVVHHADGSKSVTAPLVICQDQAYHFLLHRRMRVVQSGGNPDTEKVCRVCQTVKPFSAFGRHQSAAGGFSYACKVCMRASQALVRARQRELR
jgi:hypothetical protein